MDCVVWLEPSRTNMGGDISHDKLYPASHAGKIQFNEALYSKYEDKLCLGMPCVGKVCRAASLNTKAMDDDISGHIFYMDTFIFVGRPIVVNLSLFLKTE